MLGYWGMCCMSLHLCCSCQNHASHRGGEGELFHKMMSAAMRKCGNATLDACDKADDAKYSFPKGAINKKCTFFQWILQNSGCNKWCKNGAYWLNWRAQAAYFSWFCFYAVFKIMLPTEGGEHFFKKVRAFLQKKVLEAWKAQRK